jgi:hypothetical protein
MKKPRKKAAATPHPWKSQRRILRHVSQWAHVSMILENGGKPHPDDLAFLLRLGEPVPPDVQAYLADLLDPPRKGRGAPKKHPGQIKSDQWRSARSLYDAINKIRTDRSITLEESFKTYAAINKGPTAESIGREYWAAKKLLVADLERRNTPTTRYFLTKEDYENWERKNLKRLRNK